MKIAILGTSNSIRTDGYVPVYQAIEYPNQVDNLSLGSNTSIYGIAAVLYHDILNNYDVVITDFAVNDSAVYDLSFYSQEQVYSDFYSLCLMIKKSKCKHIHLIIETHYPDKHTSYICKMHASICEKLEIPYIYIYEPLYKNVKLHENYPLLIDIRHYAEYYAKQFAYVIKKKREEVFANDKKITTKIKNLLSFFKKDEQEIKKFYIDKLLNFENKIVRGTSLITYPCYELNKKITITPPKPNLNLEGFLIRSYPKCGHLSITIDGKSYNKTLEAHAKTFTISRITKKLTITNNYEIEPGAIINSIHIPDEKAHSITPTNNTSCDIIAIIYSDSSNSQPAIPNYDSFTIKENIADQKNFEEIYNAMTRYEKGENLFSITNNPSIQYIILLFEKNPSKVIDYCKKIINAGNQNPYFYFLMAEATSKLKQYSTTIKYIQDTNYTGNDTRFNVLLCNSMLLNNQTLEVIDLCNQHIIKNSDKPVTHYYFLKARALKNARRYNQDMLDTCKIIYNFWPENPSNISYLFYHFYDQKKYLEALPLCEQIISEDSNNLIFYKLYIDMLIKLNKIENAKKICREVLTNFQDNQEIIIFLKTICPFYDELTQ